MTAKKSISILVIAGVIGVIVIFAMASGKPDVTYTTVKAETGRIVQTVSETGTVKSTSEVSLSFLNSGKVHRIHHNIGDTVEAGTVIAELDYSDLEISKAEARANLDVARETLNKLLAGATEEEKAVARATTRQAKAAYEAAQKELEKTRKLVEENNSQAQEALDDLLNDGEDSLTSQEQAVLSAETTLNNTVATYQNSIDDYKESGLNTVEDKISVAVTALDKIDTVLNDSDGKNIISAKDMSHINNTEDLYDESLVLKATALEGLANARTAGNNHNVLLAMESALSFFNKTFTALQECFSALENSITSSTFTQTELDAFKTSISAQLTSVSTGISSTQTAKQNLEGAILTYNTKVSAARDSLSSAQVAYDDAVRAARNNINSTKLAGEQSLVSAQSRLSSSLEAWQVAAAQEDMTTAAASQHDITLQRARVRQAEASVEAVEKKIENSQLISPINGQVTDIAYEVGEQAVSGQTAATVLGSGGFEIEVLVSEADIAKVNLNDRAEITLDAYGDDVVFAGRVSFIEPAETEVQDVIYYKVTVIFDSTERRIRSGMTANVIITTAQKEGVLVVPGRSIVDRNGDGRKIRVLLDGELVERDVVTGLRGDGGAVEVLSGVREGEQVVTYIQEK